MLILQHLVSRRDGRVPTDLVEHGCVTKVRVRQDAVAKIRVQYDEHVPHAVSRAVDGKSVVGWGRRHVCGCEDVP